MEVVDIPPTKNEVKQEIEEAVQEAKALTKATHQEKQTKPKKTKKSKGMFSKGVPSKIQEKVDARVKELMEGKYEE